MKVVVFGSKGLVGSSLVRNLTQDKFFSTVFASDRSKTNLFSFNETQSFISEYQPNLIINAAAKVGGILANNTYRSEFLLENLRININIIESIKEFPEIQLINLGSSCIYPLNSKIPIQEQSLMTGRLEPTNSPYAMAKLTAIELGKSLNEQYGHKVLNLMPTNLYGPNDNFSENDSHVIPGLITKIHKAHIEKQKSYLAWGTGNPLREFLHVDDLSKAIIFLVKNGIDQGLLNVGSGEEVSIKNLINKIKNIIGFEGKVIFDNSKPDGNPRKLLDSSKIMGYGWSPSIKLDEGIVDTYRWYLNNM